MIAGDDGSVFCDLGDDGRYIADGLCSAAERLCLARHEEASVSTYEVGIPVETSHCGAAGLGGELYFYRP